MTKLYKTARGKSIDMDRVKLTNEQAIAVGNMRVNARGVVLGSGKKVATGRNTVMDQVYAVPNAPMPAYSPNAPAAFAQQQALVEASNAQKLSELANNLTVPLTPSTIETPQTQPAARGSLASSVAKSAIVTQEPAPNPKTQKPAGPSRI